MNVTVLGMGTMGTPIASNLVRSGFPTTVWDRDPARAAPLAQLGARVADTPATAAGDAEVLITMLADAGAVTSVVDHQGVLEALPHGAAWVQMGTIGVTATDRLAALVGARRSDLLFVDAPVSGSKGPAEQGALVVLASGPPAAAERLDPVFAILGQRTIWLGRAGRGMRMKLLLNGWLAFLMEGTAEMAALADEFGISHLEVLDALEGGPLAAPVATAKFEKIGRGDYEHEFALAWALKDVDLALSATQGHLPVLAAIANQWHRAVTAGYGDLDVSAARLALHEPPITTA
jgi:3-hydroxyisobutyrate dehydrogenase